MAIEIRELVVRATLLRPGERCADESDGGGAAEAAGGGDFSHLVSQCVQQVLERLRDQHER